MKKLFVILTSILICSCSIESDSDFQKGFVDDNGVEHVSNKENHVLYHLDLNEGERKTINIGVAFQNRSTSGMSSSGATIERQENKLVLISGGGGSEIKWQHKQGNVISCSRSISSKYVNEEYTFEFRLKDMKTSESTQSP